MTVIRMLIVQMLLDPLTVRATWDSLEMDATVQVKVTSAT